jgi:hypothetical protein
VFPDTIEVDIYPGQKYLQPGIQEKNAIVAGCVPFRFQEYSFGIKQSGKPDKHYPGRFRIQEMTFPWIYEG